MANVWILNFREYEYLIKKITSMLNLQIYRKINSEQKQWEQVCNNLVNLLGRD